MAGWTRARTIIFSSIMGGGCGLGISPFPAVFLMTFFGIVFTAFIHPYFNQEAS